MKKSYLILATALATTFMAYGVPARRGLSSFTQPDGTTIQLSVVGDEFGHYYLDADGNKMLEDEDGFIRRASSSEINKIKKLASERRARANASRTRLQASSRAGSIPQSGLGLYDQAFPSEGDRHALVFIVEYQDVRFSMEDPHQYYSDFLNKKGFSEHGGTGSARDWFLDQSAGHFNPTFDLYGPVLLPENRKYYGGKTSYSHDRAPEEMVVHAAQILDPELDFSKYDTDGDGVVDNIYIIYAGVGQASAISVTESVWPHQFSLTEAGYKPMVICDGVKIDRYGCCNELMDGKPMGIGTFCHEFSHVLGLPDIYHTEDNSAEYTPGSYCVMDYGSYNNDGCTPPNYSAYERNAFGWLDAQLIDGPASVTLDPIHKSNKAALFGTSKENEFFLFENRQQEGWDAYIPGHGLMIWHIDYVPSVFAHNEVNNKKNHQYVDIVEANGNPDSFNDLTMAGYTWPGTTGKSTFSGSTNPAFRDWDKKVVDLPVTSIKETDGVITFDVAGGYLELDAPANVKMTAANGALNLSWNAVEGATNYLVSVFTREDGNALYFAGYENFKAGNVTSLAIEGAEGETTYFATVQAAAGVFVSEPSAEVSVVSTANTFAGTRATALAATDNKPGSFVAHWKALAGAKNYLLTVEAKATVEGEHIVADFGSAKTSVEIPDGWDWTGGLGDLYSSNGNYGKAIPSLKFGGDASLTTSVFDADVTTVSFWLKSNSVSGTSSFVVEGRRDAGEWSVVEEISSFSSYTTGSTVKVDFPSGMNQVRFTYNKDKGNVGVDDIEIITSGNSYVVLEGFDNKPMGNVQEAAVNGIDAIHSAVRYHIVAENEAGERSLRSNSVEVSLAAAGIEGIVSGSAADVQTEGLDIRYSGNAADAVRVYNPAGALVASAVADADGNAVLTMPVAGLYIVATPAGNTKVIVK